MTGKKITPRIIENLFYFFELTKYGKTLAENIRYARYKPLDMSNEKWCDLLGDDVNNLYHVLVTYGITGEFIKKNGNFLTHEEKMILLLTAIIHDWGEYAIGDIIYGLKSDKALKKEIKAIHKIAKEVIGSYENGILLKMSKESIDNIAFNSHTKLGKTFEVIEHVGYIKTAMTAWGKSKKRTEIAPNLQWIVVNTLCYIQKTIGFTKKNPFLYDLISKNKKNISEAFDLIPVSVFDQYPEEEKEIKIKMYQEAKEYWLEIKDNF